MSLESIDPTHGTLIQEYAEMTREEVTDILGRSHRAFLEWRTSYDIIAASPLILGDLARITAPRRIEASAIRG